MTRQTTKPTLETIQTELADPDYKVRKEAIKQLMRYHRKQAFEPLSGMLQDARGDVRAKVVQALGKLKDARALLPVLGLLGDKHSGTRAQVVRALGNCGDRSVVPLLLDLLNDPKPQMRMYAARSLGQLRDLNALPAVLAYLECVKSTDDSAELYHVACAVRDFDVPGVIEPLLALYQPTVIGHPVLMPNYWLVTEVLSKQGEHTWPILLEILVDQTRPAEVRACVADALSRRPRPEYLQPLLAALTDDKSYVCVNAAAALKKLRDPLAIEPLARLLDDARENVLIAAIEALSALHATIIVNRLVAMLSVTSFTRPEVYTVLAAVIKALGQLGDAQVVRPLLDAFCQPLHFSCLSEIATTLCKLNDRMVVEPLLKHLQAFDLNHQWYTFQILEHFRDPRAVEPLLALLDPHASSWHEINHQKRIIGLLAILGDSRAMEQLRVYAQQTIDELHFAGISARSILEAARRQSARKR
ncbi:MAG TPA: HEAT repeat domain-containing protein [Ktedonobacteraceae bacterium]